VRNSSLVKRGCAENVTGLKRRTEAGNGDNLTVVTMVGERSVRGEGELESSLECREVRMQA
jgi:hypothetical protein